MEAVDKSATGSVNLSAHKLAITLTGMPDVGEVVRPRCDRGRLPDAAVGGGVRGDVSELVERDAADEGQRGAAVR
jgi:hypothetical protein